MEPVSATDNLENELEASGSHRVQGMGSVVAAVSGYHGRERFRLIKLISQTGAIYVGVLAKSTTHLVCWELEGKKYDLAVAFGTKIVSHQWFEDCLKEGRRLPEDSYIMQCGKQVGHLSRNLEEVYVHNKEPCRQTRKKRNMFSDQSNIFDECDGLDIGSNSLDAQGIEWHRQNLSNKLVQSSSFSSLMSTRYKRHACSGSGTSADAEPASRSHRRLKKNDSLDCSNCIMGFKQGCCPTQESIVQESVHVKYPRDMIMLSSPSQGQNIENRYLNCMQKHGRKIKEIGIIRELDHTPSSTHSNSSADAGVPTDVSTKQDEHSDIGTYQKKEIKETGDLGEPDILLTQKELSCVICLTSFSSTRGVLPCGHRFCYLCIQGWADRVASNKKIPTCPLCKANFTSITKMEGAASSDQKIYSQTIPISSAFADLFVVSDNHTIDVLSSESACFECQNHEPGDLLLSCHMCSNQWVHSCCLDPPLVPWTCVHCRDLRMLYQLFR